MDQVQANVADQNEMLDEISKGLEELKELSLDMNKTLTEKIKEVGDEMEKTIDAFKSVRVSSSPLPHPHEPFSSFPLSAAGQHSNPFDAHFPPQANSKLKDMLDENGGHDAADDWGR